MHHDCFVPSWTTKDHFIKQTSCGTSERDQLEETELRDRSRKSIPKRLSYEAMCSLRFLGDNCQTIRKMTNLFAAFVEIFVQQELRLVLDFTWAHVRLALQLPCLLEHVTGLAAGFRLRPATVHVGSQRRRRTAGFGHFSLRPAVVSPSPIGLGAGAS